MAIFFMLLFIFYLLDLLLIRNKAIKEYIPNIISGIRVIQSNMIVLVIKFISLKSMFDFIEEIFAFKF